MRRQALTGVALLLAFGLQAGLAPYLAFGRVMPNVLLLFTVAIALSSGPLAGSSWGFIAGLLFDLLGTGPVGPMALVLAVAGFVAGFLQEQMFAEGWLMPVIAFAVTAFVAEASYGIVLRVVGEQVGVLSVIFGRALPTALYDTVLSLVVLPSMARLLRSPATGPTLRHVR